MLRSRSGVAVYGRGSFLGTSGGVDQTVSPSTGHAVWSGYAPSVSQSANQTVLPSTGHATWAGYAPTVSQSADQTISPATGHAVWSGYAPTISQVGDITVSPATGHALWSGYAPVITQVDLASDTLPVEAYLAAYLNPPQGADGSHGHDYLRLGERIARRRGLL